jgi:hypothetical protein
MSGRVGPASGDGAGVAERWTRGFAAAALLAGRSPPGGWVPDGRPAGGAPWRPTGACGPACGRATPDAAAARGGWDGVTGWDGWVA